MFLEIIEIGSYLLLLFFAASILFFAASILFHFSVGDLNRAIQVNFEINYFTNNYQNGALSIYATVFIFCVFDVLTLSNRPLVLHTS
jgi:hypothetical protein